MNKIILIILIIALIILIWAVFFREVINCYGEPLSLYKMLTIGCNLK